LSNSVENIFTEQRLVLNLVPFRVAWVLDGMSLGIQGAWRLHVQVEGTDRGTQIGEAEERAVEAIVAKLESLCIPEPLSSPLLFGGTAIAPLNPVGMCSLGRRLVNDLDVVWVVAVGV
jgi:hypothetical protein